MFSLLNPQVLLAAGVALMVAFSGSFYAGHEWAVTKADARRAREHDAYMAEINKQLGRNRELSAAIAQAEQTLNLKTTEVIKHVPKVTTGKPCLGAGAVSLLQPGSAPHLKTPARDAVAEGPAASASDADVAYWIADANRGYETCAGRLNTLIDWHVDSYLAGQKD